MPTRLLLFLLFFLPFTDSLATHIVGGEFEMTHLTGNSYRISLNLYFDAANGDPGAVDPYITTSIFEKGTNTRVRELEIPYVGENNVNYTNPACTRPELRTRRIVYSVVVGLSPNFYTHPAGYYIAWERCCRNNVISNIQRPDLAGMTFYMEFPPVRVGDALTLNSSPKLFPPLSDYACVNSLFYYDFSGTDPDGDSLVYSLVTPLQGYSASTPNSQIAPIAAPAPYPEVRWNAGLGVNNQIPGNPTMQINRRTGLLTVLPTAVGLYVFGVKCEEYRNGLKIGEVRRDFQLKTLSCPSNQKPKVTMRKSDGHLYAEREVITLKADDARCLDLYFSDGELNQLLQLSAIPVNFTPDFDLLPIKQGRVNQGGRVDSLQTTICFPSCFDTGGKVYEMDILVRDDGCSLPQADTIRVSFVIEPRPTHLPEIRTTAPSPVIQVSAFGPLAFTVIGSDVDSDLLSLVATGRNFDLKSQSIKFNPATGISEVSSEFVWDIDCRAFGQETYLIDFEITSNQCGQLEKKITTVEVRPVYQNLPPTFTADPGTTDFMLERHLLQAGGNPFTVNFLGFDADKHLLHLTAKGVGFDLEEYGMQFAAASAAERVASAFTWAPDCRAQDRTDFEIEFTLTEAGCTPSPPQVIRLRFMVPLPETVEFKPANIFTPNGDHYNDFFEMPDLPFSSCESQFTQIQVFNRWGTEIFQSQDPRFRWDGGTFSEGVYFYVISYSDKKYKGTVTLVR